MVVEAAVRNQLLRRGIIIPNPLAVIGTLGVLMASAHWLFFPPPMETGLATRVVESIKASFEALAAAAR